MKGIVLSVKNKRNKSIVLLIVATFWFCYVGLTLGQFYYNVSGMVADIIHDKQSQMIYVEDNQVPQLVTENTSLITQNLMKAKDLGLIHFFILQKNAEVISSYSTNGDVGSLNADFKVFNQILETKNISFRTIKIFNYRLTVGIFQNRNDIILQTLKDLKGPILRDILMVTLFLSFIVYVFLKDIIDLSKILSAKNRSEMKNVKAVSKEAHTLLQAAKSYETTKKTLEYENKVYTESLTPAIVHEMKSGKKAPYSFQTSMIRVDLNGYTQIFLDKKDEYVTDMMNTYFVRAREIIERYNGLVYQYVGDEIVFHIKEGKANSQAMAVACLRSIFEIAQDIEDHLPAGADHYFKVKGSFVLGKIRFVPQDSGFGLSGLPLIESARLLSQVEDKKHSSITFYTDSIEQVQNLAKIGESKEVLLKGFDHPISISKSTEFYTVNDVINNGSIKLLDYFRGDKDLIHIYSYLEECLSKNDEVSFFSVFAILKHFKVRHTTGDQVYAFEKLLSRGIQANRTAGLSEKVLASIISLCSNLVPPNFVQESLIDMLTACLDHQDPRTQANTIIVLGDLAKDTRFLRKYIYAKHNRVSADALLVSGKENFDSELAGKLNEFLDSKNPLFQASGSFVVKHLAEYYKSTDPVFFETNPDLKELLKKAA